MRAEEVSKPKGTVLFCNVLTMISTAKVEAFVASLLRIKGFHVVVLMATPYSLIERIFKATVPDVQFVYLSNMNESIKVQAQYDAEQIMTKITNLQELVALELDGYRVGRNVQSWVLRQLRVGRLDSNDSAHKKLTLTTLANSLAVKKFIDEILCEIKPDKAFFNERGYTPAGEIFDGCLVHGVDVIQWCGAPSSDCLLYRRYNLATRSEHPLKLSELMWESMQNMPWGDKENQKIGDAIEQNYNSGAWYNRQQLQEGKALLTPIQVREKLKLDPNKKTAVIFTHIFYDATFFYGESLFEDYEQWLVESVRCAIDNTNLNWIIKVHPVNVWRSKMDGAELEQLEAVTLRQHFGELPSHIRFMPADTSINTFSLFNVIDYGLTVRGTIGMELPCFGIPVITAGTGRYSERGFTIDPQSVDEFRETLATLHKIKKLSKLNISLARMHYYGALHLRPIPMKSFVLDFDAHTYGIKALMQNVVIKVRADGHLFEMDDVNRLISWVEDEAKPELLAHDIEEAS
jgi:hypothetical protein